MKKILLLTLIFLLGNFAFSAEKIPVRIIPAENIATTYDQIQVGDKLLFKVQDDVYCDSKLIFKKESPVLGYVSFMSENGWANDNAQIVLSTFKLKDVNEKVITINSEITLDGFELLKTKDNRFAQFFNYIGVAFRGKEVDIKYGKDNPKFTIWYIK